MTKVFVGMVTFDNLKYTKIAVDYLYTNTDIDFEFLIISGKADDGTEEWCNKNGIECKRHSVNWGFPRGLNDIYEIAWNRYPDCYTIVMGNDVLPYKNSIDHLVETADETDFEWISGVESYNPKRLIKSYPEYRNLFSGGTWNLKGESFDIWHDIELPNAKRYADLKDFDIIGDSHNLCLLKRSGFDKVGYVDVNFYPAYFEDNDYGRRAKLTGVKMCRSSYSPYFHFWSRTIHEGGMKQSNNKYFPMNKEYYRTKWGGKPGNEKWDLPFGGKQANSYNGSLKIEDREPEERVINKWRAK